MSEKKLLVVVDCQNDFLHPDGALRCPVDTSPKAAKPAIETSAKWLTITAITKI